MQESPADTFQLAPFHPFNHPRAQAIHLATTKHIYAAACVLTQSSKGFQNTRRGRRVLVVPLIGGVVVSRKVSIKLDIVILSFSSHRRRQGSIGISSITRAFNIIELKSLEMRLYEHGPSIRIFARATTKKWPVQKLRQLATAAPLQVEKYDIACGISGHITVE